MVVAPKTSRIICQDPEMFKPTLDADVVEVTCKYTQLLIEYFKFVIDNVKINKLALLKFVIARGLDTMTNVFNHVLCYTNNVDVAFSYCQKSFYFYVEFVSQISEVDKLFLQLSSRDAAVYAYKKTICELHVRPKKTTDTCSHEKMDDISQSISIYKSLFHKVLETDDFKNHVTLFEETVRDFNTVSFSSDKLKTIGLFVETFYYKLTSVVDFFDKLKLFVKTISTTKYVPSVLNEKISMYDSCLYLDETPAVFVRRLF